MEWEPKVDLCFQVTGKTLPVDHGFALYAAISRVFHYIHDDREIGLRLIRGRYIGEGLLDISSSSEMVLRLPAGRIGPYLALYGKVLEVIGHALRIGTPHTREIIPSVALFSPLVTSKNGHDQARFETEMAKQMTQLCPGARMESGKRRTFQVHGKQVVGYSVLVHQLDTAESVLLQENGLGGRRKMGCGFFEPWRN